MPSKLTLIQVKEKIKQIHGDVVILVEKTYKNTYTICTFIDKDYGTWFSRPSDIMKGCGHRLRGRENASKKLKLTIQQFNKKLFKIHGDTLTLDESTYIDTQHKARFVDKDFPNDEWWSKPNNILIRTRASKKSYD